MNKFFLKALMIAALVVFVLKGGMFLLIRGWRVFLPALGIGLCYFLLRRIFKSKQNDQKLGMDTEPEAKARILEPILICPLCSKDQNSCQHGRGSR